MSRIPTITTNITAASVNGSDAGTHERLDIINDTIINKHLDRTKDSVDISGQNIEISNAGFNCLNILDTPIISGFALETTLETTNDKLDTLNTSVNDKRLDKTIDSVDISGQIIEISNTGFNCSNISDTPIISGFALETTLGTTNDKLDTLNTSVNDKHLDKTTDSVDISGQVVEISNTGFNCSNILDTPVISGFALESTLGTTNDKLDTLNNTVFDKHLDKTTDSIDITNQKINVNPTIEGSNYDLILQGSTLWADTTPVTNPFIADPLGREGWYYGNLGNIANKSNIYWYANPPTGAPGGLQENDMTFAQLSGFYSVITCDYVDNGSLTIPIFSVYSQPTGVNDVIPTFAHSRWAYSVSNADRAKFRKGETVLLYSGTARPDVFNQLPAYNLELVSTTGEGLPTEIIGFMSVNTQATTSIVGYLLQYVGYLNNSIGHIKQYGFKNSKERLGVSNLASLTVTNGVLSVSGSGGGSGGNVTVDNIASTPLITGFALETGGNLAGIKTNSDKNKYNGDNLKCEIPTSTTLGANVRDGAGTSITSTLVSSKRGLDCNIINTAVPISSATLATQATLSAFNNKFSTDNIYNTSIKTVVNGEVIVSPVVSKPNYDLDLNISLYSPAVFTASPIGLKGWKYQNSDPLKSSSVKFYANVPSVLDTIQSDIDIYNNVSYFYAIIALDYIGDRTKTANLPFLTLATQVTGVDDYIPNIANTVYKYQFPASPFTLIKGEEIIVYWCENLGVSIPQSFMPNLRRFRLDYGGMIGGPGASSKLAYLSVDTALGVDAQGGQEYRLLGAGYKFTGTGGETGGQLNNAVCDATFSAKNTIESNLSKLTFNPETNALLVSSSGGSSSNGRAYLYSGNEASAITATSVSSKMGLDVNIIAGGGDSSTPQGTYNNIHSGNLTAITLSTPFNINNLYGNESVISYEDTAIGLTSLITILGSFDNTNYFYIGVLQPALLGTTARQASAVLKLKGLKWIRILNTNATTTVTAVKCTLFSG